MKNYVDKDKLQEYTTKLVGKLETKFSSPLTAATVAEMTDETKVYVYTGSETGYTAGNWYYYDGEDWVSGGVYNAVAVNTDKTLLVADKAADGKAAGDAIRSVQSGLTTEIARAEAEEARIEALFTQPVEEAVDNWLNEHPEATTTVEDGSLSVEKFSDIVKNELRSLSSFDGVSDEDKLYDALITQHYGGNILGGNITINDTITIPNAGLRSVRISNAIITLNADMFTTSAEYTFIPSFVNCRFIGNAHAIFGGTYAIGGHFIGCVFVDCSIINNTNGTLQSAYINGCQISNTNVSLIKVRRLYDTHIISTTAESQTATLIDTYDSTFETGGTQQLWVSNSIFEGFQNTVFKLSGGNIRIKDCYFEANAGGCLLVEKNASGINLLTLEICGCKIGTNVTAFTISGFTKDYRVNVSIHDNNYSSSSNSISMVSGITDDDMYALYNNRKSSTSDVICSDALPKYDPTTITVPTINTEYFTRQSGGYVQIGAIAFISLVLTAKKAISSNLANAITGLPKTTIPHFKVTFIDGSGADTSALADLDIYGAATIRGQTTVGNTYILECSYVTNRTYTGQ